MAFDNRWAPYVPVAQRRAEAARQASKLNKKGQSLRPIHIKSKAIATSFWGLAWCKNLEIYADWANRMPRGRTYARNGSIIDLQIEPGQITALVSGSSLYKIKISIDPLNKKKWKAIRSDCSQQVSSLLDLMRGKLPDDVLGRLTDPKEGMFPSPKELKLQCSCPDYATMCKHIAATLYGVGHLLDSEPELFFKMRGVKQSELVSDALTSQTTDDAIGLDQHSDLAGEDLSAMFGIELATTSDIQTAAPNLSSTKSKASRSKSPSSTKKASKKSKPTKAAPAKKIKDLQNRLKKAIVETRKKPQKTGKSKAKSVKKANQATVTRAKKSKRSP